MPRNVTLTFNDGSSHVYNGVPDDATPDAVMGRAAKEFSGKQITNIDGGKTAEPPEPGFSGAAGNDMLALNKPQPAAFGVPTFNPKSNERAQGILETITGPGPTGTGADRAMGALGGGGQQQDWFQKQQGIESALRAQGRTDDQIAADPAWQEASKNLSRSVSAGATNTALGEVVGGPVAAGVAKGASAIGKPVVGMVRDAIGKESALATKELTGEAKGAVGQLIDDAQKNVATRKAVDAAVEGRPGARVVEVERPKAIDASKLTEARTQVRDLGRELSEANTKLQTAQRNMSGMDKYAGNRRSEPMVRAARRDLNKAQAEVNRLTQAGDEAGQSLKQIEAEHREALQATKKGERQELTTQKKIESDAASAEKQITSMSGLRAQLDAAKEPADIARIARQIGKQAFAKGKMTEQQYTSFLNRIGDVADKSKSTAEARQKMMTIAKGAALGGAIGGASAAGYEIRRFF